MRPETLALMLTKRLGFTSPDAVTLDSRSARAAFCVWTTTRFRWSLVTLKPTIAATTRAPTTIPTIRVRLDAIPPPFLCLWGMGCPGGGAPVNSYITKGRARGFRDLQPPGLASPSEIVGHLPSDRQAPAP